MVDPRPSDRSDDAFCEQVVRYLDGKSSAEDAARIERDLLDSPRRRELFLEICLQAALIAESASDLFSRSPQPNQRGAVQKVPGMQQDKSRPGSRSPVLGFLHRLMHMTADTPVATALMWMVMLLCTAMTLAMVVFVVVMVRGVGVNVHVDAPASEIANHKSEIPESSIPQPSTLNSHPALVARLIHTADCRWAALSDTPQEGDDLQAGRKLVLKSGLAEIMFRGGARALLQGPATLQIASNMSAVLERGKVTVTCEDPEAHGFHIDAPGMKFTDLGTEFGVLVAADGSEEVDVFRGTVQAEAADAEREKGSKVEGEITSYLPPGEGQGEGNSSPSPLLPHSPSPPLTLSAGQAIRVASPAAVASGSKPIVPIAIDEKQFVRALPDPYPALVLSMRPVAYYRLERPKDPKDRLLVVDSAGGHNGVLHLGQDPDDHGQYDPYVAGHSGDALRFRRLPDHDYVIVPDYPQAKENQLSVSAWALAESRPKFAQIVANWGESNSQFHLGCCDSEGDLSLVFADSANNRLYVREGPNSPFPLGQWPHVAFTIDGREARLYRNGYEVATLPCHGLMTDSKIRSMAIGCRTDDSGKLPAAESRQGNPDFSFWHGPIDEVAIFHRALSYQEIQILYKGKPK